MVDFAKVLDFIEEMPDQASQFFTLPIVKPPMTINKY